MENKIKLSRKQKEIIKLMREGWILFTGRSYYTDRIFYEVSFGYEHRYFNATVFTNLLTKNLIYQTQSYPFDFILTELGKTIQL